MSATRSVLLGLALVVSCAGDPAPEEETMTERPFLEAYHRQPPHTATGLRFFADGRMETYTNARVTARTEGGLAVEPVPEGWHEVTRMSAERVAELQEAVRDSGFFDLPERIEPGGQVAEGGTWTWTARLDGATHEVVLEGTPYARSEVIDRLFTQAQSIPFRTE